MGPCATSSIPHTPWVPSDLPGSAATALMAPVPRAAALAHPHVPGQPPGSPQPLSLPPPSDNDQSRSSDNDQSRSQSVAPPKPTRMGSGQVRNGDLMLRPQTQVSAAEFCVRREEQLSCDNTSTTAKFSRLFSVIQMLGKYNLIIARRGKSSAESLVLLFPASSPHAAAGAHPEMLLCHHCLAVLARATSSVPVL